MATVVNMHEAKSTLSKLAKRAAEGEEIILATHGKPLAMLTRIPAARSKIPWGLYKGKMKMAKDFDGPLEGFEDYQ